VSSKDSGIRVPHPVEILHAGNTALTCGLDGQIMANELHGYFVADTRVLSTYRISVSGHMFQLLSRSRTGQAEAHWEFQNPSLRTAFGEIEEGTLLLSLSRKLEDRLYDQLRLISFARERIRIRMVLQIDSDFSDIFEVKEGSFRPRLNITRTAFAHESRLRFAYDQAACHRRVDVRFNAGKTVPTFVGSMVIFDLELEPQRDWDCFVEIVPELEKGASSSRQKNPDPVIVTCDSILQGPFERGQADLQALTIGHERDIAYFAGGAPWFLTLFGRDSLTTALMSGLAGEWSLRGALAAVGALQATERDDWRDAEPGKLPHEIRRGELALAKLIPHTPYYGAHDVPALYCIALWQAWRWTGDRDFVERHLGTAEAALAWCIELGDRDGDGFLEYGTRSPLGYYNQSWKDAGDAIVHESGEIASLPLATVELQGYLYCAYLAMSELVSEFRQKPASGPPSSRFDNHELLARAQRLRNAVERSYWLRSRNYYALSLDGKKKPVTSISSNPGHLLWCGLPSQERARAVTDRMMKPDLFSGWGLRTLSSQNPAYDPLLYQRGSVWPHDTLITAAGLRRYGFLEQSDNLIRAILEAACSFEQERLPELFCGIERARGLPVPYQRANSPQAWAAAVPILAVQLFLGLVPDLPRGRCYLSPRLPGWLPNLEISNIRFGRASLNLSIQRRGTETVVTRLEKDGVEILFGSPPAPLWGAPL